MYINMKNKFYFILFRLFFRLKKFNPPKKNNRKDDKQM